MGPTIMWFRRDLRLGDNEALAAAVADGGGVVPVFVDATRQGLVPAIGAAGARWLEASLAALDGALRERGSYLVRVSGAGQEAIPALVRATGATCVRCSRDWTPQGRAAEDAVHRELEAAGAALRVSEGAYVVAPDALSTGPGGPYRVFTPYFRAWSRMRAAARRMDAPVRIDSPPEHRPASAPRGGRDGVAPPAGAWRPGETGARELLDGFAADALARYDRDHDLPGVAGTSRLSPHLAFGEISPAAVIAAAEAAAGSTATGSGDEPGVTGASAAAEAFVRQLAWREFAAHVLHHFPHTLSQPMRPEFAEFPWSDDPALLDAWRAGRTGYPLVDAGMRELAATGWMHNRMRLVCGSFLTKDLLVPWTAGLAHFSDALFDHDVASDVFNWQWVAGSGADAAPYFRVFNPVIQGRRFDPDGAYVRRWVPELARVPSRWVHEPWNAPPAILHEAGVKVGREYPEPVVDHREARDRALAAYAAVRGR